MLDTETIAEIEAVVGPIQGKLTAAQALLWAKHMAAETDREFSTALGDSANMYFAPKYHKHWLQEPDPKDEQAVSFAAAMVARSAHAMKFFLDRSQTPDFIKFLQTNRLSGFAGDKCPDTYFPTANTWFEIAFVPGQYPGVVPIRDHSSMAQLRIANLAVHAVCDGAIEPNPPAIPTHREAQILAFVTDALGQTHTYAGVVQYGSGGAIMYPVRNHAEAIRAYAGLPPSALMDPKVQMSNVSQFVCGTLAHLIDFFVADGGTLLTPATTEGTPDARPDYPQ